MQASHEKWLMAKIRKTKKFECSSNTGLSAFKNWIARAHPTAFAKMWRSAEECNNRFIMTESEQKQEIPSEPSDNYEANDSNGLSTFVRLRGLPFSAKQNEIRDFFGDITVEDIKMTNTRDGRPSGECYCKLQNLEDANRAVVELNRKEMSNRYIEVFSVTKSEADGLNRPGSVVAELEDRVIRLRGLPFSATNEDVIAFLTGLTCEEVVIGQTGGRPSGEAYARLATKEQAAQALELNRKMMGSRYIEIFRTNESDLERHRDRPRAGPYNGPRDFGGKPPSLLSLDYSSGRDRSRDRYSPPISPFSDSGYGRRDYSTYGDSYGGPVYPVRSARSRPAPYERRGGPRYGDGDGYGRGAGAPDVVDNFRNNNNVFMRGIPFDVQAAEIERFFTPLHCLEIKIGYNRENRPSGDGCVTFANPHDVAMAFERNKQYLGRRYVELFSGRDAPPPMRSLVWKRIGGSGAAAPAPGGYGYYEQGAYSDVPYDYSTYKQGYQAAGYDSYDYTASTAAGASYGYDAYYQGSGDYRGSYANGGGAQYTAAAARAPPPPPPPPGARGASYSGPAYPGRY